MDRHRLDAVPESDRTFYLSDVNKDPDHTLSFTHIGKYEEKLDLLTAVPVYFVFSVS